MTTYPLASLGGARTNVLVPKEWVRAWLITDQDIRRDLDRRGTRIERAAGRMVRKRTGLLRSTIRKQPGNTATYPYIDVVAGNRKTRYLGFEHDGTAPHVIRPKRRKALRFQAGGVVVFATKVNHPGTQGSHFLTRALPYGA